MPDHSVITSPTDQTAVARIALKALDAASHQRTGNVGSVFVPDGLAGDEDDTDYSTGIVIGTEAGSFGGIAKQDAEGNLTPLVDTDKIDQQLTQAATTAQNAVDQAANAITAVSAATDVANAANANSTEAKTAAEAAGTKADAAQNTASMVGQASTNLWPNQYFDPVKPTLTPFTPTDGVDPEPETPPVGAAVRVGGHNTRDIFNHSNDPGVRASVTPGHTYRISYTAKTIKDEGITPGGGIWYHESRPYDGIGSMTKGADLGDGWFRYTRDFVCPAGKTSGVAYIQIGNSSTKSQVMDIADLVLTDVTAEVVLTASVDANAKNTATALTNANQALARATHITTGTTAPTENVKTGDVWYPTNTDGNVIGMKMWGGSAWADVQLMAGSILVPGSVGATQIADGTITTPKLNVTEDMAVKLLQAHKIEAGEIDLNTLNGQVITGATLKTAADGSRIEIFNETAQVENGTNSGAIRFYNSSGEWVGEFNVDDEGLLNIMTGHLNEQGEPDPMYFANITNVMGSLMLTSKQGVSLVTGGGQWDFRGDGSLNSAAQIYLLERPVTTQTNWHEFGYGKGYKQQSFGFHPGVSRIGNMVFAHGTSLKSSGNAASGDTPFGTIPEGWRPAATTYGVVTCAGGVVANMQINTNGTSSIKGSPNGGTTPWISLDGLSWQTADILD